MICPGLRAPAFRILTSLVEIGMISWYSRWGQTDECVIEVLLRDPGRVCAGRTFGHGADEDCRDCRAGADPDPVPGGDLESAQGGWVRPESAGCGRGISARAAGRRVDRRRDHALCRWPDRPGRLRQPVTPPGVPVPRRVPFLRLLGAGAAGDLRRRRPDNLRRPGAGNPRAETGLRGRLGPLNFFFLVACSVQHTQPEPVAESGSFHE